jgi:hypothetical protein
VPSALAILERNFSERLIVELFFGQRTSDDQFGDPVVFRVPDTSPETIAVSPKAVVAGTRPSFNKNK